MPLATRVLPLSALLLAAAPLSAQDYTGTYVVRAPAGNMVTLVLQQNLKGKIRGELSGNGTVVQIDGRLDPGGTMVGTASSNGQSGFAAASLKGDTLQFMIADFGPDGKPNFATAQATMLFRKGSPSAPKGGAAPAQPPAVNQSQPQTGPGPAPEQQLAQLLLSSSWCSFSYNQTSGRTTTARYTFRPDGTVAYGTNTEGGTVNQSGGSTVGLGGGATGSVYGQSEGGGRLRWQVQQGTLSLDQGQGFQPVALTVTRNSSGYPIITADGAEYSQCN